MKTLRCARIAAAILAAMTLWPASASAQLEDLFQQIIPGTVSSSPSPAGDGAAVLVTAVSGAPDAGVELSDTVYPGQAIDLGRGGRLTLAYGDGCRTESFVGGIVSVGAGTSQVAGGRKTVGAADCGRAQVVVDAHSAEAGAGVNRLETPFDPRLWAEATVASARPQFSGAGGTIRILMLDAASPQLVWEGQAGAGGRYPGSAPKLQPGLPYRVEADGRSAVFSIDPGAKGAGAVVALR